MNKWFLNPKDIINKTGTFIDYSKIDSDNREITRSDLWYIKDAGKDLNLNTTELQIDTSKNVLEITVIRYNKIKDSLKSSYDELSVIHFNSARIPIAEFKFINCELENTVNGCGENELTHTKLTYKFESFEFKELNKDEDKVYM